MGTSSYTPTACSPRPNRMSFLCRWMRWMLETQFMIEYLDAGQTKPIGRSPTQLWNLGIEIDLWGKERYQFKRYQLVFGFHTITTGQPGNDNTFTCRCRSRRIQNTKLKMLQASCRRITFVTKASSRSPKEEVSLYFIPHKKLCNARKHNTASLRWVWLQA